MGLVDSLLRQLVISNLPVFQFQCFQYMQICVRVYVYKLALSFSDEVYLVKYLS